MPKRKNWSDDEWLFLLKMAEDPVVNESLSLIGVTRRGPPAKDDRHLATATYYVVEKWYESFDHAWVEESQAEFLERKSKLKQTLPDCWRIGMEYVRRTAESEDEFKERRERIKDVSGDIWVSCLRVDCVFSGWLHFFRASTWTVGKPVKQRWPHHG